MNDKRKINIAKNKVNLKHSHDGDISRTLSFFFVVVRLKTSMDSLKGMWCFE